jgi:hypothetical protein
MPALATCQTCGAELHGIAEVERHRCPGSKATRSKYNVSARAKRTDADGIVYDSALEMKRANELKAAKLAGEITEYLYHVRVRLGDIVYETDFMVIGPENYGVYPVHFEDTKGVETPSFRRVRKLWTKYMTLPLYVLKRGREGWTREIVNGK